VELLTDGHSLLEGPRQAPDRSILFSDVIVGGVYRLAPGAPIETVVPKRRGVGGLVPHADGGVVVTGRDLAHVAPDGTTRTILAVEGVTGFNDLTTDREGAVLVGALRYRPMAGEAPVAGEVWRVGPDGSRAIVARDIEWVNGLGLSPDGETLYVSDFQRAQVLAYELASGTRRVFADSPRGSCDGLTVDADGGVWVALGPGGGIAHLDAAGGVVEIVDVPAEFVSSVAFAGPELRQLLITTVGALYRAPAPVAGLPVAPARV
jgi:sugar lactone lactonase YvrE